MALLFLLPTKAGACSVNDVTDDDVVQEEVVPVAEDSVSIMVTPLEGFDYKNTEYWSRNKAKKFAATSTLAVGGATLLFYGILKKWVNGESLGWVDYVFGGGGGLLVASSIPLYISASKDRRKAKQSAGSYVPKRDYRYSGFRYEVSLGTTYPTDVLYKGEFGACIGVEGRTYIGDSNFDVAAKFSLENVMNEDDPYYDHDVLTILRLSAFADYNFCKGKVVNPYIGLGLGTGVETMHVEPRVGVELWRRHRVAFQWRKAFYSSDYYLGKHDNISLTYGYSF